jgi:hypothetical protein
MPWTVTVQKDPDKPDVGQAIATYSAPDFSPPFVFSARGEEERIPVFVEAARAALAVELTKRAKDNQVAADIEALLNAPEE